MRYRRSFACQCMLIEFETTAKHTYIRIQHEGGDGRRSVEAWISDIPPGITLLEEPKTKVKLWGTLYDACLLLLLQVLVG